MLLGVVLDREIEVQRVDNPALVPTIHRGRYQHQTTEMRRVSATVVLQQYMEWELEADWSWDEDAEHDLFARTPLERF